MIKINSNLLFSNKTNRLVLICILTLLFSCTDAMNHQINASEWPAVKEKIENDRSIKEMERLYIVDQIASLIDGIKDKNRELGTFKEKIDLFSSNYLIQYQIYTIIKENNSLLKSMVQLNYAESISIDKEKGFIIMDLNFSNVFDKEIDYILLRFEFEDDYGNVYFNETSKLSYQTANDFNSKIEVIMTDVFKNENEFIFLNNSQSSNEVLKSFGIERDNSKKAKNYLMEGLKVSVIGVLFKDGQGIMHKSDDWKYYE